MEAVIDVEPSGRGLADRRSHARETFSDRIKLIGPNGRALEADVVDRSLRGLRVRIDAAASIPGEVHVLSLTQMVIHLAHVVWRSPPYAGLSIVNTTDMRMLPTATSAGLHKLWREHIGR